MYVSPQREVRHTDRVQSPEQPGKRTESPTLTLLSLTPLPGAADPPGAHEGGTVSLQVGWDEYFGIPVVCGILGGLPTVLPIPLCPALSWRG
jgi:hypothetical protein